MPRMRWMWAVALLGLGLSGGMRAAYAGDSWHFMSQDFPSEITWHQSQDVSVNAQDDGDTTWSSNYDLREVVSPSSAAFGTHPWGVTSVPVDGLVSPGMTYRFAFGITSPPMTTLDYALPITPTTPPSVGTLPADWVVANGTTPIATDEAKNDVVIARFPDVMPSAGLGWATPYVEELAGHVPAFVNGLPDGSYHPDTIVTRDQMAVFVARAVAGGDQYVPSAPAAATFTDVPLSYWAFPWIEAAVAGGVVEGYSDHTYRPIDPVTRDQMAVFVARGMAGGDSAVPAPPDTATFPDVVPAFWAYKYIEYAAGQHVVTGYPDRMYKPAIPVSRGQMAVFIYRGFVQPTGAVVVLAGPGVTAENTGTAYVGFDAVRLKPWTPLTVTFALRTAVDGPVVASHTQAVSRDEITAAQAAVVAHDGQPYFYISWDANAAGAPAGSYILTVDVNGTVLPRTPKYTIAP